MLCSWSSEQSIVRVGLDMHTRATGTWSQIARSALRGYVVVHLELVQHEKNPEFERCVGSRAQGKECSVCYIPKMEDRDGSGVPDSHMAGRKK